MSRWDNKTVPFEILKGKVIENIVNEDNEKLIFFIEDGETFQMLYYPDCCAHCDIEEIHGDLMDVLHTPILLAEEVFSTVPTEEIQEQREAEEEQRKKDEGEHYYYYDRHQSETWTFYKLATIKGNVTIRWYGSSNGYYSESATFEQVFGENHVESY